MGPYDVLTKALVGGMTIVGHDFRDGICSSSTFWRPAR
jgi:methanogenic corrinoid protein MtbC1